MAESRPIEPGEIGGDEPPANLDELKEPRKEGPPKKPRTRKTATTPAPKPRRATALEKRLLEQMVILGMIVGSVDAYDGVVIMSGSERFAAATVHLAEESPKFKAALESALEMSAWGEFVAASAMIVIPIASHHGLVKMPSLIAKAAPDDVDPTQNGHSAATDV